MGNDEGLAHGACQEACRDARPDLKNEVALDQHCAKPAHGGPSNELEGVGRLFRIRGRSNYGDNLAQRCETLRQQLRLCARSADAWWKHV
jgi:hypothetical protein